GDPIYWFKIYGHSASIVTDDQTSRRVIEGAQTVINEKGKPLLAAATYYKAASFVNGHIVTLGGVLSFVIFVIQSVRTKQITRAFFTLLPIACALFIMISLFRGNIPIKTPDFTMHPITDSHIVEIPEYNMRYGIIVLPVLAIT